MAKKRKKRKRQVTGRSVGARTHKRQSKTRKSWIMGIFGIVVILALILTIFTNFSEVQRKLDQFFPKSNLEIAQLEELDYFPPAKPVKKDETTLADFIGASACADCHREQYDLWKQSTHGKAGGPPDEVDIISKFNGDPLEYEDATVTPVETDNEYRFIINQKSIPEFEIAVDAVVGGGFMVGGGTQAYFSEFPDGTLRFLPFDFIRKENKWFSQIRSNNNWVPVEEGLALSELSEWPPHRILGSYGTLVNCQNCHGSQIQVDYSLEKGKYNTRYKSLKIDCESCHGPAKRHVELMNSPEANELEDIGISSLQTLDKDESLLNCLQCHAVKDVLVDNYLPPSENLQDYYSLKFPMLADNPYFEDGRIRSFAYQQTHLYSDCYLNGSMTCVSCHSPHSNSYRDISGNPLRGRFDNGQCLGCHASKAEAPEEHSNHPVDSEGNLCTSCHMNYLQHQSVGEHLRFARSDHSIPIPRPEFDTRIGIQNACVQCHGDKSVAWLQEKVDQWYGKIKPHKRSISVLVDSTVYSGRLAASEYLLITTEDHPMAQFSGLSRFIKDYLGPNLLNLQDEIVSKLKSLSQHDDIDIKSLALMGLHLSVGNRSDVRVYLEEQLASMADLELPIRMRWSLAIDHLGIIYSQRREYYKAITTHKKSLEIRSDDPYTLVNLGNAYGNMGQLDRAIASFTLAHEIRPEYEVAPMNIGSAYLRMGDVEKAIRFYEKACETRPSNTNTHLLLSRAYLSVGQVEQAIEALNNGLSYAPNNPELLGLLSELKAL